MEILHVETSSHSAAYDIWIGGGLISRLGPWLHEKLNPHSCAVITDSNVAPLQLPAVQAAVEAGGMRCRTLVIPPGETFKTLETLSGIWNFLLENRWERGLPIIALGGGVVGDMAGFAAATVLRGVPLIQMPTTLLAAVDASVGGKTGIDHPRGKNLLGAFHHASLVVADVGTLNTLPICELECGLAECIKHSIIRDPDLYDWLDQNIEPIMARDPDTLTKLIHWNVGIKADFVAKDPLEKSIRAFLNFGHTFGHALESTVGYGRLPHGRAVALGMLAATHLSIRLGICDPELQAALEHLIRKAGLPVRVHGADPAAVLSAMYSDKKVASGKLRLVLPIRLGEVQTFCDAEDAAVLDAIGSILQPAGVPAA